MRVQTHTESNKSKKQWHIRRDKAQAEMDGIQTANAGELKNTAAKPFALEISSFDKSEQNFIPAGEWEWAMTTQSLLS